MAVMQEVKDNEESAQRVLCYMCFQTPLKLLHPFMPFITEEIYSALPREQEILITSAFPQFIKDNCYPLEEGEMEDIMGAIKAIRNIRSEMNVVPSKKTRLTIVTEHVSIYEDATPYFERLAYASEINVVSADKGYDEKDAVNVVTSDAKIFIPLGQLVDFEKELQRLEAEKEKLISEINRVEGKLSNEKFISKAPQAVIDEEKQKGQKYEATLKSVLESIEKLKK